MNYETRERINGLINQNLLKEFENIVDELASDLIEVNLEGFEYSDIKEYLIEILDEKLGR